MEDSKKEKILKQIEVVIKNIKTTTMAHDSTYYANTVGYVDRQYNNITLEEVKQHPTNWVVINNLGEKHKALVGGQFENRINIQIIGFVRVINNGENLDTLMNSLQKDIMLAMLNDVGLGGLCSYLVPTVTRTVDKMIYPYGGFAMHIDCVYVTFGKDI